MADTGNSEILPVQEAPGTKQGQSFGYPGERGGGVSVIKAEPTTRTNGKVSDHA